MMTSASLPGMQTLEEGLSLLLQERGFDASRITISSRESNVYQSTSPCEIVTCRLTDGKILKLLCKYSTARDDDSFGHRRGIAYEGEVYRRILMSSQLTIPVYYGTYMEEMDGRTWLVTEYLHDGCRISNSTEHDALSLAAEWIGKLHAAQEVHDRGDEKAFLSVYNADYYSGWLDRAAQNTKHLQKNFPWLGALVSRFEECITVLTHLSQTVIHGEYYPSNILIRNRSVYPVDWESAAIGPGEIDLAAVTEGWPEDITQECKRIYRSIRWPGAMDQDFDRHVDAASIYLCLRWLGDADVTTDEDSQWHLEHLYSTSLRFGLLGKQGV